MKITFTITAANMATLLLLNVAITDILTSGGVSPDILEELERLQPDLDKIIFNQEKSPLNSTPSKAAI